MPAYREKRVLLRLGSNNAAEVVGERDEHYEQILGKLTKFKRGQKKRTSLQQHKFDWATEYRRLRELFESQWQDLPQRPPSDAEVEAVRSELTEEVREARELLASARDLTTQHQTNEPSCPEDDGACDWDTARALLAQCLLGLKSRHEDRGGQLADEVRDAERELVVSKRAVTQVMQEDRLLERWSEGLGLSDAGFLQSVGDEGEDDFAIEMARSDILNKLQEIEERYILQVQRLAAEGGNGKGEAGPWGGWAKEEHDKFVHVLKSGTTQGKRVLERLRIAFPGVSLEELKGHEKWVVEQRFVAQKRQALEWGMERDVEQLRTWARQALVDAREAAARERARMTELEQWEASRMQRHEALREARRRREEHEEQRRQRDEEARREMEELERAKRDKEAAEQAVRKGLVAAFHEQLAKGREEERRREEQQRARDEEDRLRRMAENQGRVEFRERVLEERAQRAEACKRQAAVVEEKRLQALLRLAAMVPYADRIANIQADPLKPTKFTEGNTFLPDDGSSAFRPLHGYTDKKLFKDVRFRLGLALQKAGLANHSYARQVIAALAPRAPAPYV